MYGYQINAKRLPRVGGMHEAADELVSFPDPLPAAIHFSRQNKMAAESGSGNAATDELTWRVAKSHVAWGAIQNSADIS